MPNNIVVDTTAINNAIKRVNALWAEANTKKYYVQPPGSPAFWSNPLHIDSSQKDLKIEAVAIPFSTKWAIKDSTATYIHNFTLDFATNPVVSVLYDGNARGVVASVDFSINAKNATDTMTIHLTKPNKQTWHRTKKAKSWNADSFYVHIIAIGN